MDNYYKTLNVEENASFNEIKSAYRRLSMEFHPDRPNGNEENFKKINEAYEVLSDDEKRGVYDMQRKNPFFHGGLSGGAPSEQDILNLLFAGMPGMAGIPGMSVGNRGVFSGGFGGSGSPQVHIFRNGMRMGAMPSAFQKPTPIIKKITITLTQAFTGCNIPIEIERWVLQNNHTKMIEKEKIYVEIPMGVDTNEIIIIREKGNIINDNNKGDIKVFVKIQNDSEFERNGLDLIYTKNISLQQALTGFKFDINFINGKVYTITSGGKVIKPNYEDVNVNMGMCRGDRRGHLIIRFTVDFPTILDDEQKALLNKALG